MPGSGQPRPASGHSIVSVEATLMFATGMPSSLLRSATARVVSAAGVPPLAAVGVLPSAGSGGLPPAARAPKPTTSARARTAQAIRILWVFTGIFLRVAKLRNRGRCPQVQFRYIRYGFGIEP